MLCNIELLYFIELMEINLKKKAIKEFLPIQPGDVEVTFADTKRLEEWINFTPQISIEAGVKKLSSRVQISELGKSKHLHRAPPTRPPEHKEKGTDFRFRSYGLTR